MAEPLIHLTNFSSRRLHQGAVYTIMARPRAWELGAGVVCHLTPPRRLLDLVKGGRITIPDYLSAVEKRWRLYLAALKPGALRAMWTHDDTHPVPDGSTLCCACSRAEAAAGRCHRVVAAQLLSEAGWKVVLDGEEVRHG